MLSNIVIEPYLDSSFEASMGDQEDYVRFWIAMNPNTRLDRYAVIFEAMTKTGCYDSFYTLLMNRIGYVFHDESDSAWIGELVHQAQGFPRQEPNDGYRLISYDELPAACQNALHAEIREVLCGSDKTGHFDRKYRIWREGTNIGAEIFAKSREDALETFLLTHEEAEIIKIDQIKILNF